jgi:large subunit ribosomal protein L29
MKAKEVHKLSDEELDIEVHRLRRKLFELGTQAVTEKIQDTSQFKKIRKDIARVQTERSARRLAASNA